MIISKSRNAGLFAELTTVVRHIKKAKEDNKKIFVLWGSENSLYYQKDFGENVWEYYFNQVDGEIDEKIDFELSNYIPITKKDNLNIRETFNYYIINFIKLNEKTQNIIDQEISSIDEKTLGLHLRKTDKFLCRNFNEPMALPVDDELVFNLIDDKIKNYNKIFLATDCSDTYNSFKKRYGSILLDNKKIRGNGQTTIHTSNKENGYQKGLEALIDSYALSKCGFLIRSTSNLSSFSMFLNLNLECININELYRNDIREYEFNIISKL